MKAISLSKTESELLAKIKASAYYYVAPSETRMIEDLISYGLVRRESRFHVRAIAGKTS